MLFGSEGKRAHQDAGCKDVLTKRVYCRRTKEKTRGCRGSFYLIRVMRKNTFIGRGGVDLAAYVRMQVLGMDADVRIGMVFPADEDVAPFRDRSPHIGFWDACGDEVYGEPAATLAITPLFGCLHLSPESSADRTEEALQEGNSGTKLSPKQVKRNDSEEGRSKVLTLFSKKARCRKKDKEYSYSETQKAFHVAPLSNELTFFTIPRFLNFARKPRDCLRLGGVPKLFVVGGHGQTVLQFFLS